MEETADSLVAGVGILAGRDLDGMKGTDATFWRAGTRVLPGIEGRVRRGSYRAGWRRLTARTALGAAVAEGGYRLGREADARARSLQSLWENYDTALAMHEALAKPLGMSELTDPRRYLHIPRNFSDDDAEYASTPPLTCGSTRTWSPTSSSRNSPWRTSPSPGAARARTPTSPSRETPPRVLRLSDPCVREIPAKIPESAPLIGLGAGQEEGRRRPRRPDSPHVLISAGSEGGKSTILRTICCQFIHNGAHPFESSPAAAPRRHRC